MNDDDVIQKRIRELEQEVEGLKKQLEDRKVVERAKGVVMRLLRIDEGDAYRRLHKYASDHNAKLIDVAWKVINSEEVFRELRA